MRLAFILVAAVVLLASGGNADACECAMSSVGVLPAEGSAAPTNTRIWTGASSDMVQITDSAGVVPATRTVVTYGRGSVTVWTPSRELAANSTVEVLMDGLRFSFTTTNGPDLEAPAPPEVEHITTVAIPGLPTCFPIGERQTTAQVEVQGEGAVLLADVNGASSLNEGTIEGAVTDLVTKGPFVLADLCGTWPGGETARVRVSAFDLAGNFSSWSQERRVVMPPVGRFDACRCSIPGGGSGRSSLLWTVVAVLAVVWRRRQRSG